MKLNYDELNAITAVLEEYIDGDFSPSDVHSAQTALTKLKEFVETSGTVCPTAILLCPQKLGGKTSDAKAAAARENGKKGGRPRKDGQPCQKKVVLKEGAVPEKAEPCSRKGASKKGGGRGWSPLPFLSRIFRT